MREENNWIYASYKNLGDVSKGHNNVDSVALTVSKLHSEAGSLATLSWTSRSFLIASFVILRTSSGVCVHTGGGWGGVRWAMLDEDNDEEANMLEREEENRVAVLQTGTE